MTHPTGRRSWLPGRSGRAEARHVEPASMLVWGEANEALEQSAKEGWLIVAHSPGNLVDHG